MITEILPGGSAAESSRLSVVIDRDHDESLPHEPRLHGAVVNSTEQPGRCSTWRSLQKTTSQLQHLCLLAGFQTFVSSCARTCTDFRRSIWHRSPPCGLRVAHGRVSVLAYVHSRETGKDIWFSTLKVGTLSPGRSCNMMIKLCTVHAWLHNSRHICTG